MIAQPMNHGQALANAIDAAENAHVVMSTQN